MGLARFFNPDSVFFKLYIHKIQCFVKVLF